MPHVYGGVISISLLPFEDCQLGDNFQQGMPSNRTITHWPVGQARAGGGVHIFSFLLGDESKEISWIVSRSPYQQCGILVMLGGGV